VDQGFEDISLNSNNILNTTRIIASKINESNYLGNYPGAKSFTLEMVLSTGDPKVSPMIDLDRVNIITIMSRLNSIESKIEKYRTKTPEERLELRSYDSYPFNQKLSDFFEDKEKEMELTGKKEYILTPDEVTDVNASEIKGTFQPTKTDDNRNYGSR
jgi:hypothetical protein